MTREERALIKDLNKCDFGDIARYYEAERERKKAASKEEKQARCSAVCTLCGPGKRVAGRAIDGRPVRTAET